MKETPFQVLPKRIVNGNEIELRNIMELSQGGPETGWLYVNGELVTQADRFGGPILVGEKFVFAPVFKKRFFKTGFKIAKIEIATRRVELINGMFPLLNMLKFDGEKIFFFTDVDCTEAKEIHVGKA